MALLAMLQSSPIATIKQSEHGFVSTVLDQATLSVADIRKPGYPVDPIIINRWSPRSMSGESISERELMTLFEAARWAPSSYNGQPWRFIYARRESKAWDSFCGLLDDFNKGWAPKAAALIVVASHKVFDWDDKPSRTHSFDAGAAWQNFALQGSKMGLVVHGMEGFDYDRAQAALRIPDAFDVEAMVAVGRRASVEALDQELREMESPSDRRPLAEIAFEGTF
jgi:nitroreductase